MSTISKLNIPVMVSGEIEMVEYDLPSGGGSGNSGMFVGTCTTAANVKNKEATVDSSFSLVKGATIAIKFSYTNSYQSSTSNPITLNVNSTGAKNIYYNVTHSGAGNTGTSTVPYGVANRYNYYVYDGNYWVWTGTSVEYTYSPQSLGFGYGSCTTAYATTAKVATLSGYNLVTNGSVVVKFKNAVNANATLNINNRGAKAIFYRGKAIVNGIIKAGDTVTFIYDGTRYHVLSTDNPWKAYVNIIGDPEAEVTVTNTTYEISDTVILDSEGKGYYVCKAPGDYVFSVEDE